MVREVEFHDSWDSLFLFPSQDYQTRWIAKSTVTTIKLGNLFIWIRIFRFFRWDEDPEPLWFCQSCGYHN